MIEQGPGFIFTVAVFLAALTVLVFVHEMGHYLVARWCKVKVDVFSVGFGRELFGRTDKHGTRWKISAIPLGGYVKFAGDATGASNPDDEALENMTTKEKAESFHFKSLWQKSAIVFAGPFINIVFAVILFAGLVYVQGQRVMSSEIGMIGQGLSAEKAGLKVGDIVLSVDGTEVERLRDISEIVQLLPEQTIDIGIERDGENLILPVLINSKMMTDRFDNEYAYGYLEIGPKYVPWIGRIEKDLPAYNAGLEVNDLITNIDGIAIDDFQAVYDVISVRPNKVVSINIERDGEPLNFILSIGETIGRQGPDEGKTIGYIGIGIAFGEYRAYGPFEALVEGTRHSINTLRMITTSMGQLIMGMRSVREMGGPVRVAAMAGEVAQSGFDNFIRFVAMISINLGFVNLLPIPMLDGGHLLFYGLEAAKGGPLPKRAQELAFMLGFVFVIGLMLFLTLNDLHSIAL